MARYSETIETTEQAIRDFAASLRLIASSFDKQADTMHEFGLQKIQVTHWKSAKKGVSGFAAFAGAIQDAILETELTSELDAMPTQKLSVSESQQIVRGRLESPAPSADKTRQKKGGSKK